MRIKSKGRWMIDQEVYKTRQRVEQVEWWMMLGGNEREEKQSTTEGVEGRGAWALYRAAGVDRITRKQQIDVFSFFPLLPPIAFFPIFPYFLNFSLFLILFPFSFFLLPWFFSRPFQCDVGFIPQ
ncbi:hypothetical protein BJX96DRAFT_99284 [Aspergillus floccosus]